MSENCAYVIGSFNEIPGTDQSNFVVLGTYGDKDTAKAAIGNLAPAMMNDQYKNGVTLYKLTEESKVYTFHKKDLVQAYQDIQKQQQEQLEQQKKQLEHQQAQIQKQIDNLKSGEVHAPPNVSFSSLHVPAPTPIVPIRR